MNAKTRSRLASPLRYCGLLLLLLAATGWVQAARAASLTAASSAPQATISSDQRVAAAEAKRNGEPAKPEEDDQAEFRQSASVRGLARITGLTVEQCYWACVTLNFAILAGILIWAGRKILPGFFRARSASIRTAIDEARRVSQDAGERLSEIEKRLSRLDAEIAEIGAAAEREAAAEEERILAATEADTRRILQSAEQEITAAGKLARRELAAFAADLAVGLASKQIHVEASVDRSLVQGFTTLLSDPGGRAGKESS